MTRLLTTLFLLLHLACAGQILNGSFENWTFLPDADINPQKWSLNNWQHLSPNGDSLLALIGTYRDSMPKVGNFALGLSRWYNYTYDVAAFRNACPTKPTRLTGFFKYDEGTLSLNLTDTARVSVYLTRFNTTTQQTDTVGLGQLDLPGVDTFTFFDCPITYGQPGVYPDSLTIILKPTKFRFGVGGCNTDPWCSFLTVDELALAFSTPAPELPTQPMFRFFPNPASDRLTIEGDILGERVLIFNVLGQLQFDERATADVMTIGLGELKSGLYLLKIREKTETFVRE